jgi:cytochrome P450
MINIYGMHRRPDLFSEPARFDPDRFAGDFERGLPRTTFIPFGAGPRICIGNHFALMEAQIALATIVQKVRVELLETKPVEPETLITLRPRNGIAMRVRRSVNARTSTASPASGRIAGRAPDRAEHRAGVSLPHSTG